MSLEEDKDPLFRDSDHGRNANHSCEGFPLERRKKKFGRVIYCDSVTVKLSIVLVLIVTFSSSLFAFGISTKSLALISEGFHTCSDVVGYLVGIIAHNAAKHAESSDVYPFGLVRSTVVGSLFNGLFLVTASIVLTVETIGRLLEPEEVEDPRAVMYIGIAGIVVNFAGMLMLCGDSAAAGAHGHSHGGGGHSHSHGHSHNKDGKKAAAPKDLNIYAIVLHLFVDCASSLSIAGSGAFMVYTRYSWKFYADSVASIFIIILIFTLSIPLVYNCLWILLQSNEGYEQVNALRSRVCGVDGVAAIDHLELWRLNESMYVCSIKVRCDSFPGEEDYRVLNARVKNCLEETGYIHYSTVEIVFGESPQDVTANQSYGTIN